MNFLQNLAEQARDLWTRSSMSARIGYVAVTALAVLAVVGVGIWSARPEYMPLAANLTPTQAAEIVSQLNANNIANKMNFAGSSVLVPKNKWNEARLAVGDEILGPVPSDGQSLDSSILGSPVLERHRLLRSKEEQLERTIMRLKAIDSADVHIAQPEWTPFQRNQQPATASVVLGIRPGIAFSREQAATIVALVAGSVDGLSMEQVTVTDLEGRTLSGSGTSANAQLANLLDYRRQVEAGLASKAELMLAEMLGEGRAIVRVTADIDFTETTREEMSYDPERNAKTQEEIVTETQRTADPSPVGVAGASSNLTNAPSGTNKSIVTRNSEKTNISYANAEIKNVTRVPPGKVTRITVAAMVDLPQPEGGQAAAATISKDQVEAVIRQAVGFDADRNDQIEVLETSLVGSIKGVDHQLEEMRKWEFFNSLARNCSLGLAAIIALILGLMIIRKIQPVALPRGPETSTASERSRLLSEFAAQAQSNPEVVSKILAAWLDVPSQKAAASSEQPSPEQGRSTRAAA